MEFKEVVKNRYSCKKYSERKVDRARLNDILEAQICHSVYFEDTLRYLKDQGVDTFIEIGPGKSLSSFVNRTLTDVNCFNVSDLASFNATLEKLL